MAECLTLAEVLSELHSRFQLEHFRDKKKEDASPLQVDPYWADTFHRLFVHSHQESRDDLLFFVKVDTPQALETVEVLRKDSRALPGPSDNSVLWDQTLYLNLLLHEFMYHVTCSTITVKPGTDAIHSVRTTITQQVYPSPTHRRMDKKGKVSDVVYPNLMFCVDNFEEVFNDVYLQGPGEKVAVQLLASNKSVAVNQMVFLGAVDYAALKTVHERKEQVPLSTKLKKLSVVHKRGVRNFEHMYKFIPMRGPEMKGFAEMAVWKGAVAQAQSYGPVAPQNHVPPGNEKEEPCGDKSGPLDGTVSDSIPADQSSIRASDSRSRVESSHLASTDSSSEEEECTAKTETQKKGIFKNRFKLQPSLHGKQQQVENGHPLLFAHLTYVQLPWYSILDDILNSTRKPPL